MLIPIKNSLVYRPAGISNYLGSGSERAEDLGVGARDLRQDAQGMWIVSRGARA
jgi:hypothetical protein